MGGQAPVKEHLRLISQLDLHDLDLQSKGREAQAHHFWKRVIRHLTKLHKGQALRSALQGKDTYLGIMSHLGEKKETEAALYMTCIALRDERLGESTDLPLLVKPHLPALPSVDHVGDIRDGDTCFSDIRGYIA